jgi:ABC-2 type transport system permease protein
MLLAGHPLVLGVAKTLLPQWLVDGVAALSFITHFSSIAKGVIDLRDLLYFGLLISFFLYATSVVIDLKKAD